MLSSGIDDYVNPTPSLNLTAKPVDPGIAPGKENAQKRLSDDSYLFPENLAEDQTADDSNEVPDLDEDNPELLIDVTKEFGPSTEEIDPLLPLQGNSTPKTYFATLNDDTNSHGDNADQPHRHRKLLHDSRRHDHRDQFQLFSAHLNQTQRFPVRGQTPKLACPHQHRPGIFCATLTSTTPEIINDFTLMCDTYELALMCESRNDRHVMLMCDAICTCANVQE